ncbi:MAG: hypothetical protein JW902_20235 [Syntrophaceae bacterium]|nr:hypothetical protein [Syntrophaceae bacterium]
MLMLTHTWFLKELLALCSPEVKTPDVFAYNICPDLLPIHRNVHASMTHRISRFIEVPREHRKAHYVQLHLLADDIAHHGRICEEVVTEFNPNALGYAYVTGRPLVEPIMDYCNAFDLNIDRTEAAYRSHMIIELSVDIFLRKNGEGQALVNLFQDSLEKTERLYIQEFMRTLSWLFGIEEPVIREALNQGMMFYTAERMVRFVDEAERAPRYVRIFGLSDKNEAACAGMKELMSFGMSLVGDPMDYLHGVVRTIRESPYCKGL